MDKQIWKHYTIFIKKMVKNKTYRYYWKMNIAMMEKYRKEVK